MVKVTYLHWATNNYKYQFGIQRVGSNGFKRKVKEYKAFTIHTWWRFFFIIYKD